MDRPATYISGVHDGEAYVSDKDTDIIGDSRTNMRVVTNGWNSGVAFALRKFVTVSPKTSSLMPAISLEVNHHYTSETRFHFKKDFAFARNQYDSCELWYLTVYNNPSDKTSRTFSSVPSSLYNCKTFWHIKRHS